MRTHADHTAYPFSESAATRAALDAIVDIHEAEGVYLDCTTSAWPQVVIVRGQEGQRIYAVHEDGQVLVEADEDYTGADSGELMTLIKEHMRETLTDADWPAEWKQDDLEYARHLLSLLT